MAKGGNSATTPTWTSWSPSHVINQNKIRRLYFQIPSAQQGLLARADAWSARGVPNIPPEVLENLRGRHARESGLRSQVERETLSSQPPSSVQVERETFSSQPPSSVQAEREIFSSQPASPVPHNTMQDKSKRLSAEEEENDVERKLSWSPSPSAHLRGPSREEELAAPASISSRSSAEELDTRPAAVKAVARTALFGDFPPSSSLGSETGLEVEVPKAITDVLEPVNRGAVAVLEPTPPSAQVIPSTLAEQTASMRAPDAKRRGRMRRLAFASPDHVGQRHHSRLAPPKAMLSRLSRSPSPVVTSSPPVSKAALRSATRLSTAEEGQWSAVATQPDVVLATSQLVSNHLSRKSADELPPNNHPSQDPFTLFKAAYPDCEANLGDFIRGVIVLFKLQKLKAFPGFLYDDFIRVFSGDYLRYITDAVDDNRTLTTKQWYCDNVSKPLYTKGIITKSNVESVLKQYPDRVRAIQQELEASETRSHSPAIRSTPGTTGAHKDMAQQTPVTAEAMNVAEYNNLTTAAAFPYPGPANHNPEPSLHAIHTTEGLRRVEEPHETVARPRSNIGVARTGSARRPSIETANSVSIASDTEPTTGTLQSRANFSLLEIERTQTPQVSRIKRPVVSTLASAMFSQQSKPKSIPETTIKRRRAPRFSNGSPAGEPGAAFKKPKNATKSKETRDRRFRQFLISRSTQGSTPGGSAAS